MDFAWTNFWVTVRPVCGFVKRFGVNKFGGDVRESRSNTATERRRGRFASELSWSGGNKPA
jgi:hypothetical protein